MNVVTQKRLGTFNVRAFSLAIGAALFLIVAMLAVGWISTASSNSTTTHTKAAPSNSQTYTGPPRPLHLS